MVGSVNTKRPHAIFYQILVMYDKLEWDVLIDFRECLASLARLGHDQLEVRCG
jgi:hypothetical protein